MARPVGPGAIAYGDGAQEVSAHSGDAPSRVAFYTASRASLYSRPAMWRAFRREGVNIVSTWIDEAGDGETGCFTELWDRIFREIAAADRLVLYAETGDFPLKGALIEVGIALGMGRPVTVCLPGVEVQGRTHRPIGSWIEHRLVTRNDDIRDALGCDRDAAPRGRAAAEAEGQQPGPQGIAQTHPTPSPPGHIKPDGANRGAEANATSTGRHDAAAGTP